MIFGFTGIANAFATKTFNLRTNKLERLQLFYSCTVTVERTVTAYVVCEGVPGEIPVEGNGYATVQASDCAKAFAAADNLATTIAWSDAANNAIAYECPAPGN